MQSKIREGGSTLSIKTLAFDHYPVCELNSLEVDNFTVYWTKLLEITCLSVGKILNKASLLSE